MLHYVYRRYESFVQATIWSDELGPHCAAYISAPYDGRAARDIIAQHIQDAARLYTACNGNEYQHMKLTGITDERVARRIVGDAAEVLSRLGRAMLSADFHDLTRLPA